MSPAPITLFVYNRPAHTRQTVEALQKNALSKDSDLIIFSDAPKTPKVAGAVREVREYIKTISEFKSVTIVERDKNWGLANSIIDGVRSVVNERGRIIVLEDDLVVSPVFLAYMNKALDKYESDDKVMQVSAYMFPIDRPDQLPDTFLCRLPTSWGWASWRRAWKWFEADGGALLNKLETSNRQSEFNMHDTYLYSETLAAQAAGTMDVWGVRWYASMFLRDGLCLYPARSLVLNNGMDGSGVHCGSSAAFDVKLSGQSEWAFPDRIDRCEIGEQKIVQFFKTLRDGRHVGVIRRLVSRAYTIVRSVFSRQLKAKRAMYV